MLSYSLNHVDVASIVESSKLDLYQYRVYIGKHNILTDVRNSYWYIDNNVVISTSGTGTHINSDIVCTEIFGYTPETRTSTYDRFTDLPYINGCSSKQLINPNRLGDPTWQMLLLPPHTSEQKHHIHSTSRVVYVAEGSGKSIIGQVGQLVEVDLKPGTVIILDKMVAHHFITTDQHMLVLPLHIFSSTTSEKNHPMFNGTYET